MGVDLRGASAEEASGSDWPLSEERGKPLI